MYGFSARSAATTARCLAAAMLMAMPLAAQSSAASARAAERVAARRSNSDPSARDVDTTFTVASTGIVDITIRRGRLWVRGTNRSDAGLWSNGARVRVRSAGVTSSLDIGDVFVRDNTARNRNSKSDDEPQVRLELPRGARVVIHGASASAKVADMNGDVEVHLQSGDIELNKIGGRAILETLSGSMLLTDGVGDLHVITTSGDVTARGVRGAIDVSSTSGSVDIDAERASQVSIDGVSGEVRLAGSVAENAKWSITTHSGEVALFIGDGTGVLDLVTFTGDIDASGMTRVPVDGIRNSRAPHAPQRFDFGGGGSARVSVSTFSGDITIRRSAKRRIE